MKINGKVSTSRNEGKKVNQAKRKTNDSSGDNNNNQWNTQQSY